MMFVPWSGLFSDAVAVGEPVGIAIASIVIGLLAATTVTLVLGAERKPRRLDPAIALQPSPDDRAAAA